MVKVKFIPVIVSETDRDEKILPFVEGSTIKQYLMVSGFEYKDSRIVSSCSAKEVKDLDTEVADGTEFIITHPIGEPISAIATLVWAAIVAHPIQAAIYALSIGYAIYSARAMRRPQGPSFGRVGGDGLDGGPSYNWNGMQTTQDVGLPIPIAYGRVAVPGNRINQYVWADGDKNYLNDLVVLSEGEIDGIESLHINENPSANFDGIDLQYRMGTNVDTVIPNFEDLHDIKNIGATLTKDNPYVHTTVGTQVEAFEVSLSFSSGLYQQDSETGVISSWAVTYLMEYKLHASGTWITLGSTTVDEKTRSVVKRIYRKVGLARGQYDIRVTKTSDDGDFYHTGDLQLEFVDEIRMDDLAYPNVAKAGVRALATEQLSGGAPNYRFQIRAIKVRMPAILYSAGGAEVDWEDYYWDHTDSQWKLFSNDSVLYWDGVTYIKKWGANPIWCIRDLLTHERYGLGNYISSNIVDDTVNLEMAKYCEQKVDAGDGTYEKRFRLDVVIDSPGRALDVIAQLCSSFRGVALYTEGNIKIKVEKAETPVQLFGMGNVINGSFSETWKSKKESYNIIEVTYVDKDKAYRDEVIAIIDHDAIAAGAIIRKKAIRIFTTKQSYAVREGNFLLRISQQVDRAISFRTSIGAIACMAFDVISFSHDVPQIGYSGTVKVGSAVDTVRLSRPVTLVLGTTYKLRIQFADGTIEEQEVLSAPGTYSSLATEPFAQAPAKLDMFAFGPVGSVKKDYRIISLRREANYEVTIAALEYKESIYPDTGLVLPDDNYSSLTLDVPLVTNLGLTEGYEMLPDGTVRSSIEVWFRKPEDQLYLNKYKQAKIYFSEDGGTTYSPIGVTDTNSFVIDRGLLINTTYHIKVVTICVNGIVGGIAGAPSNSIILYGKRIAPANVTNFTYTWGENLDLSWEAVTDMDLGGYEIRDEDTNWGTFSVHQLYKGTATKKVLNPDSRAPGTYYLRAYNTSNVYSNASATITPTNAAPAAPTLAKEEWFGFVILSWTDSADTDLLYYEIYKSNTNVWAGEETLYARVSGKSSDIQGNTPEDAIASSPDADSITDTNLIGKGADYFVGDRLLQTSGTHKGQEATVTVFDTATGKVTVASWPSGTPDAGDRFAIKDRFYCKVRGVDRYGGGSFSSAQTINIVGLSENMLGDEIITARKITTGELITLSAQIKDAIITNAKIYNLDAAKIIADTITADKYSELRNTYIYNSEDSLDATYPFEVPFKIVSELLTVQSVKLSFKILKFRAYSTAVPSGGGSTTPSGGGSTTPSGGGSTTPSGGSGNSGNTAAESHRHYGAVESPSIGNLVYFNVNDNQFYHSGQPTGCLVGPHSIYVGHTDSTPETSGNLKYVRVVSTGFLFVSSTPGDKTITSSSVAHDGLPSHSHTLFLKRYASSGSPQVFFDYPACVFTADYNRSYYLSQYGGTHLHTTPEHTHDTPAHTHDTPAHTHDTPAHTHSLSFGIHEEDNSPTINVYIDNGAGYGASIGSYAADQTDINITAHISGAGWKAIKFTSTTRTRIAAIIESKLDIEA